jgi:type VI secretion system ImpB/VipA family protein
MTTNSQKNLAKKPRVQIEYDVDTGGAIKKVELPWVTAVMSDLSGDAERPDLDQRRFDEVSRANFDDYLRKQKPRLQFAANNALTGQGSIGVDLTFEKMSDFEPGAIVRKAGSEIEDIELLEEKRLNAKEGESRKYYTITHKGPFSIALGDTIPDLKVLTVAYVAYKLGMQPGDLEISLVTDERDSRRTVLRVIKKGPLSLLLDARNRLEELLRKAGGKTEAQKLLDQLFSDKSLLRQFHESRNPKPAPVADESGAADQSAPPAES